MNECPFCDSDNTRYAHAGTYRCLDCGSYFDEDEDAPLKSSHQRNRKMKKERE